MKNKLIAFLLPVCLFTALCTACGGGDEPDSTDPTPLVLSTGEPIQAEQAPAVTSEPRNENNINTSDEIPVTFVSEDQRAAEDLKGESVELLFEAIGQPSSTDYGASCLEQGSDDGRLYYDNFVVSTLRRPDGSEIVTGTWSADQ